MTLSHLRIEPKDPISLIVGDILSSSPCSAAGRRRIQHVGRVGDDAVELLHIVDAVVVVRLVDDLHDLVTIEAGVVVLEDDEVQVARDGNDKRDDREDERRQCDLSCARLLLRRGGGRIPVPGGVVLRLQGLQVCADALLQGIPGATCIQTKAVCALLERLLVLLLLHPLDELFIGHLHDNECPFVCIVISTRYQRDCRSDFTGFRPRSIPEDCKRDRSRLR